MFLRLITFLVYMLHIFWKCEATIHLQPNNLACKKHLGSLLCDFGGTAEVIELGNLDNTLISFKYYSVILQNAATIGISQPQCYDITFKNIKKINYANDDSCPKKGYNVYLLDSEANCVPRKIAKLSLSNSHVQNLKTDQGLWRLHISQSSMGMLNIPWPVGGVSHLTIEHSKIDNFINFNIHEKVSLNLHNVTIKNMQPQSISIGNSALLHMTECTITKAATNAIVIKPGSKMIIKNLNGNLPIISQLPGKEDIEGKRPPGVPAQKPLSPDEEKTENNILIEDCVCSSSLLILSTVVAFLEALFILYIYFIDRKTKLIKNSTTIDSETGCDSFNINIQHPDTYNSYYSSGPQYPNAPPVRRR